MGEYGNELNFLIPTQNSYILELAGYSVRTLKIPVCLLGSILEAVTWGGTVSAHLVRGGR